MPVTVFPPSGGADPTANVFISGEWTINDPVNPLDIANKEYVDNAIQSSGGIEPWVSTISYSANNYVTYANSIWISRSPSTNNPPSLATNVWRQLANLDSAQNNVFTGAAITATTYNFPISQTAARYDSTAANIVVQMPTIAALSSTDTPGRAQWFRHFKTSQANSVTINLGAGNTFLDGSTSWVLTAQGVYSMYAIFQSSQWSKG